MTITIQRDFNFTTPADRQVAPFNFTFGALPGTVYNILKGTSNNFVAVWADSNAGLNGSKFQIASKNAFNVVELLDNTVYDWYTETQIGRGGEALESSDIIDTNVV